MNSNCDKDDQGRHAAISCWPIFMWRTIDYLRLREDLNHRGFDGCIGSIDAEPIIHYWQQAGWIEFSPDGMQIRITSQGREQFETWKEEDRLWGTGDTNEMPMAKRLVAGEPARNLLHPNGFFEEYPFSVRLGNHIQPIPSPFECSGHKANGVHKSCQFSKPN